MKHNAMRAARRPMMLGLGLVAGVCTAGCAGNGSLFVTPVIPQVDWLLHSDAGFLAGQWIGQSDGALIEEHWSQPSGDHMMGMFRWCGPHGVASLFEILTIRREGERVVLRLRHFSAELAPWASEAGGDGGGGGGGGAPRLVLDRARSHCRYEPGTQDRAVFEGEARAVFVSENGSAGQLASVTYHVRGRKLEVTIEFVEAAGRAPLVLNLERAG
jgi:hypothetical protein